MFFSDGTLCGILSTTVERMLGIGNFAAMIVGYQPPFTDPNLSAGS
jgi:hypothetical protein